MSKKLLKVMCFVLAFTMLFSIAFAKPNNKVHKQNHFFVDLNGSNSVWAYKAIDLMYAKGLIKGIGNGEFAPMKPVTHLEAIVMILRTMGLENEGDKIKELPPFYKGNKPSWGMGFITLAYEKGLITADELKAFNPMESSKRYEIAKYLVRSLGLDDLAKSSMDKVMNFNDWNAIPKDAKGYIYVAVEKGLLNGDGKNIYPNIPVTRAEMAAFLERLDNRIEDDNNEIDKRDIAGTVYAINDNSLSLKVDSNILTYKFLNDNIPVYNGDNLINISTIKNGDKVRLILNDNSNIIFIEIKDINDEEVIPIELNKVADPPKKVVDVLNKLLNRQEYSLINDNGIYYIIATRGEMRTGGYSINIDSAKLTKDNNELTLEVNVSYVNPSKDSMVTQVITYPYDIRSFKYDGKITKVVIKTKVGPDITKIDYLNP